MGEEIKFSEVVRTFREQLGVKPEKFSEMLTHGLLNISYTRQTIYNWESGKREPDISFLLALYTYHFGTHAWQLGFAAECLKAMRPETFKSGIIELSFPKRNNHNKNE